MTTARARKTLFALLLSAAGLSACASVDPFQPNTDPQSAAQAAIAEETAEDRPYPRWSRFPGLPTGLVGPDQVAADVARLEGRGEDLYAWARSHPPFVTAAEARAWAARTRGQIDPRLAQPAPPDWQDDAQAYAARLRALATPPPVAK